MEWSTVAATRMTPERPSSGRAAGRLSTVRLRVERQPCGSSWKESCEVRRQLSGEAAGCRRPRFWRQGLGRAARDCMGEATRAGSGFKERLSVEAQCAGWVVPKNMCVKALVDAGKEEWARCVQQRGW